MDFAKELDSFKAKLGVTGGKAFSKNERETLYALAFGKYEGGYYDQAADFFTQLLMHDPYDVRFWKGLASSCQMAKKYLEALKAWAIYALLSGHSADGHFHAAECYLSIDEIGEAKKALHMAEKFAQNSALSGKITNLKDHLHG